MTTKTDQTDQRADVQGRLDAIGARIQGRADEIADIERRQLAAAAAGETPDGALSTAKVGLLDAQGIDERAAAAVRAQLDQIDAQAEHERAVARLAQLRRDAAEKAREVQAEADAFPAALNAALDALRASGVDLCDRIARIRELTAETATLTGDARALAEHLGEPVGVVGVVDHLDRIGQLYPVSDLHRARVLNAARRNPVDTVHELGAAVGTRLRAAADTGRSGGLTIG